jgi:acetolactate decarboxylase
MNFSQTKALIEENIPSENLMYAIRIDGEFNYMKTRSVPSQTKPYPRLIDVINNEQAIFELSDVKGSIVGFWLPYYVEGMNVPGYHFHFINEGRNTGGHTLDYKMTSGTIYIDYTYELELTLPQTDEFAGLDLQRKKDGELHSVESNKK